MTEHKRLSVCGALSGFDSIFQDDCCTEDHLGIDCKKWLMCPIVGTDEGLSCVAGGHTVSP